MWGCQSMWRHMARVRPRLLVSIRSRVVESKFIVLFQYIETKCKRRHFVSILLNQKSSCLDFCFNNAKRNTFVSVRVYVIKTVYISGVFRFVSLKFYSLAASHGSPVAHGEPPIFAWALTVKRPLSEFAIEPTPLGIGHGMQTRG